ncbi:hypothetical protein ACFX12_030903 [Malus domestica]
MKADKASKSEVDAAIEALNALKLEKASIENDLQATLSSGEGSGNNEAFLQQHSLQPSNGSRLLQDHRE